MWLSSGVWSGLWEALGSLQAETREIVLSMYTALREVLAPVVNPPLTANVLCPHIGQGDSNALL